MARARRCRGCGGPLLTERCLPCRRNRARARRRWRNPNVKGKRSLREREIEAETGMRRCTSCRSMKPLDAFYQRGSRLRSDCMECTRSWARRYAAGRRELRRGGDERLQALRRAEKQRVRARRRAERAGREQVTLQLEAGLVDAIQAQAVEGGISAARFVELLLGDALAGSPRIPARAITGR